MLMCAVLSVLSVGVYHYANKSADYAYDRLLSSASLTMAEGVFVHQGEVDFNLPYAAFEMLQLSPNDKVFYAVYDGNNSLISGYKDLPIPIGNPTAEEITQFYFDSYLGEYVRFIARKKRLNERSVAGVITIVLGQTTQAREQQMKDTLYAALTTQVGVIILAMVVMAFAIGRALNPLDVLSKYLKSSSPLQRNNFPKTHILEVQPLTNAIDDYRSQWLETLDSMKTFIEDASHQIRTAQATTKAQLEVALSKASHSVPKAVLENIHRDHSKLTRLTNQLLSHATVVHRGDAQQKNLIVVSSFLRSILTAFVKDNAHVPCDFSLKNTLDNEMILGDEIVLREAFRNLVDNAIQHAGAGKKVMLSAKFLSSTKEVEIAVEDAGPGIPVNLRSSAIKRFSKVGAQQQGSGLGLAIVNSAALTHRGYFKLSESELGGLKATLVLPVFERREEDE